MNPTNESPRPGADRKPWTAALAALPLLVAAGIVLSLSGFGDAQDTIASADDASQRPENEALPTIDDARLLYERNQWRPAFEAYSRLADAGDPEAARVALMMSTHGPGLYGTVLPAGPQRIERWRRMTGVAMVQRARLQADAAPAP